MIVEVAVWRPVFWVFVMSLGIREVQLFRSLFTFFHACHPLTVGSALNLDVPNWCDINNLLTKTILRCITIFQEEIYLLRRSQWIHVIINLPGVLFSPPPVIVGQQRLIKTLSCLSWMHVDPTPIKTQLRVNKIRIRESGLILSWSMKDRWFGWGVRPFLSHVARGISIFNFRFAQYGKETDDNYQRWLPDGIHVSCYFIIMTRLELWSES